MTRNYKSRDNYSTGGWCCKRSKCDGDCRICYKEDQYKEQQRQKEKDNDTRSRK